MSGLISPILPGIQSRGLLYTSPLKADFAAPQKTSIKELPQATQTLGPAERMSAGDREIILQTALASWAPFVAFQELKKEEDKQDEKTPSFYLAA